MASKSIDVKHINQIAGLSHGTACYIPDDKYVWLPVIVENVDPKEATITVIVEQNKIQNCTNDTNEVEEIDRRVIAYQGDKLFPLQNPQLYDTGFEDMIHLNYLHEAAILYNIKKRFHMRLPYTYTGDVCIAVNPYQQLPHIYAPHLHTQYLQNTKRHVLPPHVYAVSVGAYQDMILHGLHQSIIVSGESGAGKTETTKIVMGNLATIATQRANKTMKQTIHSTIDCIMRVSPLLETFGNAKTKRNDNSSRFGKFTQLQFNPRGILCGAMCETYLLEKTRVVHQEEGEQNYHIFYQLLFGTNADERSELALPCLFGSKFEKLTNKDCGNFKYLSGGITLDDTSVKYGEDFANTKAALDTLGLDNGQQENLFKIIAGILHLGQIICSVNPENEDASYIEPSSVIECKKLLGLDISSMNDAICSRTMKAGGEVYSVPLTSVKASAGRDALAKALYANMFDWLVRKINATTTPKNDLECKYIGVLDIFGFESFENNSFEQLCINYANEKLQQKFIKDVFRNVQEEYSLEGISWDHITYVDNADLLEVLEGKMGIISILNEEVVRPRGNEEGFVNKLAAAHGKKSQFISFSRMSRQEFTIHHYVESVTYNTTGFLEKHKDALLLDLTNLMLASTNPLVQSIFVQRGRSESSNKRLERLSLTGLTNSDSQRKSLTGLTSSNSKRGSLTGLTSSNSKRGSLTGLTRTDSKNCSDYTTVGDKFKKSLNELMLSINTTKVRYIRCIKPNSIKSPSTMEHDNVVRQLRSAGVIDAIRIARSGYPTQMNHHEFLDTFDILLRKISDNSVSEHKKHAFLTAFEERESCLKLVSLVGIKSPEDYQLGRKKIFLKRCAHEKLENAKSCALFRYALAIQRVWKGYIMRKAYSKMITAIRLIQKRAHVYVAKSRFCKVKVAADVINRVWRGHQGRKLYRYARACYFVILIQRTWRGHKARITYHDLNSACKATLIQKCWRGYQGRKIYRNVLVCYSTVRIQRLWRGHKARVAYHKLITLRKATLIQRYWRGHQGRKLYRKVLAYYSIVRIQRLWRGYKARITYHERLTACKATIIQRYWRGQQGRKHFQKCLHHKRAVQIQRLWRGSSERKKVQQKILDDNATQIQRKWRGYKCRVQVHNLRINYVRTIQRIWRGYYTRKQAQELRKANAVIRLQCCVRCFLACKAFSRRRKEIIAATLIQKTFRGTTSREFVRNLRAKVSHLVQQESQKFHKSSQNHYIGNDEYNYSHNVLSNMTEPRQSSDFYMNEKHLSVQSTMDVNELDGGSIHCPSSLSSSLKRSLWKPQEKCDMDILNSRINALLESNKYLEALISEWDADSFSSNIKTAVRYLSIKHQLHKQTERINVVLSDLNSNSLGLSQIDGENITDSVSTVSSSSQNGSCDNVPISRKNSQSNNPKKQHLQEVTSTTKLDSPISDATSVGFSIGEEWVLRSPDNSALLGSEYDSDCYSHSSHLSFGSDDDVCVLGLNNSKVSSTSDLTETNLSNHDSLSVLEMDPNPLKSNAFGTSNMFHRGNPTRKNVASPTVKQQFSQAKAYLAAHATRQLSKAGQKKSRTQSANDFPASKHDRNFNEAGGIKFSPFKRSNSFSTNNKYGIQGFSWSSFKDDHRPSHAI